VASLKVMDPQITENNLIDEMRTAFPELEDAYQQIVEKMGSDPPGRYTIVGETLAASIRRELSAGEITEFLRRSAVFMERVSVSGDEVINIIWINI
jgi:hypothetical protein